MTVHMYTVPEEARKGIKPFWNEVRDSCELPSGYWEWNLEILQEQPSTLNHQGISLAQLSTMWTKQDYFCCYCFQETES